MAETGHLTPWRQEQRQLLLHGNPVQADKRLIEQLIDRGIQPRRIANLLAWRREVVGLCLKEQNGGRVLVRDLVAKLAGSRDTVRRNIQVLLALPPGPKGQDYRLDETYEGRVLVVTEFERAYLARHTRQVEARRKVWRERARRQRARSGCANCAPHPLESPSICSKSQSHEMSKELVYIGSKKKKEPPPIQNAPPPPVVPSTTAPKPTPAEVGWVENVQNEPLFVGLEGLEGRALLDAVFAREQQQAQEAQVGPVAKTATDEVADVTWWRANFASRVPDFDPRFLAKAGLSRRYLAASVALVLRQAQKTRTSPARRVMGLARTMQRNQFLTPFAESAVKALGTRYETRSPRSSPWR